ncbi:MAG: LysR substrate-binding domain-containing protein, partial [Pseudomonadales bacterium]|nr:LysR substrate-binding domain-containing protein [Pseudomonadales bacterium]
EHLIGRKVASLPWSIYASPTYLDSAPELSSLADLSAHNLIGGSGSMLNLPAFSWLEQHHPERITTRCDELTAMSYFAESGHGIALLPADQQRPGIVKCCKFDPAPASDIWLLTHPDLRKTARIRLVMNCLKQYFEEIGDSPTP